jgi:DNA-binding transcriptional regulator GbsR (MarR family)
MLLENKKMGLTEIVKQVDRAKSTVCFHMTKLRMANLVRYEKDGKETVYWIKYPACVKSFFDTCEMLIARISKRIDTDT